MDHTTENNSKNSEVESSKENLINIIEEDNFELNCSSALPSSPIEAEFGDSPSERDMAIEDACENNWDSEPNFSSSEVGLGVIALPPPPMHYDIDITAPAESPSYNTELENLFNTDSPDDANGPCNPGVCGLCNLGNTCFMNSGLQCLLNTPSMVQFFMKQLTEVNNTTTPEMLIAHVTELFHKVWSGKYNKLKPTEFHQALAANHTQFKDYRQHDCQEFLALVLGSLHELLNTASSKSHVSDLSGEPMTPHSRCDDEQRNMLAENVDHDSISQMALSIHGLRCEASSSSHSSESSDEVRPFKCLHTSGGLLWEAMDSIREGQSSPDNGVKEEASCSTNPNGNLISYNLLKKDNKLLNKPKMEKNHVASLNNINQCFRNYEDILKDAKTSNVNVLVTEQGANNEIIFDSEKFPKHENTRRRDPLENPNITEYHNFEAKTASVKRIKETNKLHDNLEITEEAFGMSMDNSTDCYTYNNKRFKLEENLEKEKNYRMEYERKLRDENNIIMNENVENGEFSGGGCCSTQINLDDDLEADKHWEKHLGHNQSVIVDSFQGQFKSSVVCSECSYVSSTYEPFMYLSVPLPHAMEQQVSVTFVPANSQPPTKFLLTLNKQDRVSKMKQHLLDMMQVKHSLSLELAEVLHHHIARILDENHFVRYIGTQDPHRSIYAFEMSEDTHAPREALNLTSECDDDGGDCTMVYGPKLEHEVSGDVCVLAGPQPDTVKPVNEKGDAWKSCAICLEEVDKGLKNHKNCTCFLCDSCIERSLRHYNHGNNEGECMKCPVCNETVSPEVDFVQVEDNTDLRTSIRLLKVPVLFRQDTEGDGNNNEKCQKLFGHPHLVRLANRLKGSELYDVVGKLVPYSNSYTIVLVDGQGYHCSRCMYTVHCKGCRVSRDTDVCLQTGDNLAVRFTTSITEIPALEHDSLLKMRKQQQLSIYDCLDAFSESETLDEHNPWYCPTCQRNQCATKTLSVWRYPDFLIVYLKRFVFHEYTSVKLDNKVSFPLTGLNLLPPSRIQQGISRPYNLYACVNHFGGVSAGHYTAYAKHPQSGDWHLFNDDTVTRQKPQEEDYSHAYVLFYQKQGVHVDLSLAKCFHGDASSKPNIDQLILELDSSVEQDSFSYLN